MSRRWLSANMLRQAVAYLEKQLRCETCHSKTQAKQNLAADKWQTTEEAKVNWQLTWKMWDGFSFVKVLCTVSFAVLVSRTPCQYKTLRCIWATWQKSIFLLTFGSSFRFRQHAGPANIADQLEPRPPAPPRGFWSVPWPAGINKFFSRLQVCHRASDLHIHREKSWSNAAFTFTLFFSALFISKAAKNTQNVFCCNIKSAHQWNSFF